MEKTTISAHEIRIVEALRQAKGSWLTNRQIAEIAGVAGVTARHHVLRLVRMDMVERTHTFPGYSYRWKHAADQTNGQYLRRIAAAMEAMGEERVSAAR